MCVGKKEVKLLLFNFKDEILCEEDAKIPPKDPLELISKFNNTAGYKINNNNNVIALKT